jgi:hypothetical protein
MKLKHETDRSVPQDAELRFVSSVHRLAADYDVPARRFVESPEHVKERALPRAAGADDRDHLASLHGEINTAENGDDISISADESLVKLVCFENWARHSCRIASRGKRRDA